MFVVAARAPHPIFQKSPGGTACSGWDTRPEACEHVAPTELARGGWRFLRCYKHAAPTELKRKLFDLLKLSIRTTRIEYKQEYGKNYRNSE